MFLQFNKSNYKLYQTQIGMDETIYIFKYTFSPENENRLMFPPTPSPSFIVLRYISSAKLIDDFLYISWPTFTVLPLPKVLHFHFLIVFFSSPPLHSHPACLPAVTARPPSTE